MRQTSSVCSLLGVAGGVVLITLGAGCRAIQGAADIPRQAVCVVTTGQPGLPVVDPADVQASLLRFTDDFDTGIADSLERLRHGANAVDRAEILKWKIAFGNKSSGIVSGPNAIANLLDMAVFISITQTAVQEHWQPEIFGESAGTMLACCRNAETNIWRLVDKVVKPGQQAELRAAIRAWCQQNELTEYLLVARVADIVSPVPSDTTMPGTRSGSLFDLLTLDPLAGLDPATREIAQTRLFAQRALYLAQKMPQLMRWQMELFSLNVVAIPAVEQLVTNTTQLTTTMDRFALVAERLPGQVRAEREEILKALQSQERQLTPLLDQALETLAAGAQLSTSVNTTLTTFDGLRKHFGVGEPRPAGCLETNHQPFRILDYAKTAAQLEATAQQLTVLLRTFDQTLGSANLLQLPSQVRPAVQEVKAGGRAIVDYAFWHGILLVFIVFSVALLYRLIAVGLLALLLANMEHWRCMRRRQQQYAGKRIKSLAGALAAFISFFGVLGLFAVIDRQ
jgi:hypothetical protein